MKYQYFINETEIKEPLNISGFKLSRQVSKRFNGSIYDAEGTVEGINGIIINDPNAIALITGLRNEYLTEATAEFKCTVFGKILFKCGIDFSNITTNRNGELSISLMDYPAKVFMQNIDEKYSIPLNTEITIPSEKIYTDYALSVNPEKNVISIGNISANTPLNPVFKFDNKATLLGTLLETQDYSGRPFYKNATGQKMRLNMSIELLFDVTVSSSVQIEPKIVIKDSNGVITGNISITKLAASGTKTFSVIESYELDVPNDSNVSILLYVNGSIGSISIAFQSSSVVNLSEGDLSNVSIPAISVHDAFAQLIEFTSNGALGYAKTTKHPFDSLFLSPFSSVRGREAKLNISLGELWDDLNAIFCVKLSKVGDNLISEPYVDSFSSLAPYVISDILDYSIPTDFGNLYNSIECGFDHWKAVNDAGIPEQTATMSLKTGLSSAPSALDIKAKSVIASLKILSECYLMRNRAGTENENSTDDQRAFLLSIDPDVKINSKMQLDAWSPIIGSYHGILTKKSGEGAYMMDEYSVNLAGKQTIFTPDSIIISCNIPTEDFVNFGDTVKIIDRDKEFDVYIDTVDHFPLSVEDGENMGNTAIKGRILNI